MPALTRRPSSIVLRARPLAALIVLLYSIELAGAPQDAHGRAIEEFQRHVGEYLALRTQATRDLPDIPVTGSIEEIVAARELQVRAVRSAREDAEAGDVFGPRIIPIIRVAIVQTLKRRGIKVADLLAETGASAPGVRRRLAVNDDFPWHRVAAMTIPLIVALPQLPRPLEYRFLERDLILLDVDLDLVVDILADALPMKENANRPHGRSLVSFICLRVDSGDVPDNDRARGSWRRRRSLRQSECT